MRLLHQAVDLVYSSQYTDRDLLNAALWDRNMMIKNILENEDS